MAKHNSLIDYCNGRQEFLDNVTDDLIVMVADYEEEEELSDVVDALQIAIDNLLLVLSKMKGGEHD